MSRVRKIPAAGPKAMGFSDDPWELNRTAFDTHLPCHYCDGEGYRPDGRRCGPCGATGLLSGMGRENSGARIRKAQDKHLGRDGVRKPMDAKPDSGGGK